MWVIKTKTLPVYYLVQFGDGGRVLWTKDVKAAYLFDDESYTWRDYVARTTGLETEVVNWSE